MDIESIKPHERELVDLKSVFRKARASLKDDSIYDNWVKKNEKGLCVDFLGAAPIYHPDLALIFFDEDEMFFLSEKGTVLDRNLFKAYYLKGAKLGIQAYMRDYHVPPNKRFGENLETWKNSITALYHKEEIYVAPYQFEFNDELTGCKFVKDYFPNKISLAGMEWLGYWSLLTKYIEELSLEVPDLLINVNGYLNSSTVNIQENNDDDSLTSKTEKSVDGYLQVVKDVFNNDEDYNTYLNLLVQFFQGKDVCTKGISIKLKRNSKTKVLRQHNVMHKELALKDQLRSDEGYTEVIKVLHSCSNLTHQQIYDAMTK